MAFQHYKKILQVSNTTRVPRGNPVLYYERLFVCSLEGCIKRFKLFNRNMLKTKEYIHADGKITMPTCILILIWPHKLRSKNKMAAGCHSDIWFSINACEQHKPSICTPVGMFVQNFSRLDHFEKLATMSSWRPSWIYFRKRNSIKSLGTSPPFWKS